MKQLALPTLLLLLFSARAYADDVMRTVIEQYQADYRTVDRLYDVSFSESRSKAMRAVIHDWQARLDKMPFDKLSYEDQVDFVLLKHHLKYDVVGLDREAKDFAEVSSLLSFTKPLVELIEAKQKVEKIDPKHIADVLTASADSVRQVQNKLQAGPKTPAPTLAKARRMLGGFQRALTDWYDFYNGYDPMFTWWAATPYKGLTDALQAYAGVLGGEGGPPRGRRGGGTGSGAAAAGGQVPAAPSAPVTTAPGMVAGPPITGIPVGREALMEELDHEMVPYTPEELISVAEKELAWCEGEMRKASNALGYGDDWKKALEHVKNEYVQPGEQPQLIQGLAREAIDWVEAHKLVTIPELAKETWRVEMMSPQRQLVNPFFTGGATISVSFPTDSMTEEQKLMSLRGNNRYFSRATVFHELIPGHYLQEFMTARYRPYRQLFDTPFWIEGGALYWELTLYADGFAQKPEEKIGMLFWRMHRCARIIFSLGFHMGKMTPQQCVDFLVDRIGHERANAEGEVRRSFAGGYSTLYQAAYLVGGMQLRALRHQLVDLGKMSDLQFNDAIVHEGTMPIEMVRAALTHFKLTPDYDPAKDPDHLKLDVSIG